MSKTKTTFGDKIVSTEKRNKSNEDGMTNTEVLLNVIDETMNTNESEDNLERLAEKDKKHVTYSDTIELCQDSSVHDMDILNRREDSTEDRKCTGANISNSSFKRKVTFSNEIIVIAYDDEDDETYAYNYDDIHIEEPTYKPVFDNADRQETKVNYVETTTKKNIFKAVSFSNEVTVIDDDNLVFTTNTQEDADTAKQMNARVDKLLSKLKKVVKKLEDKSKCAQSTQDKEVLGDAEQSRNPHQVEIVQIDGLEKDLVFSDQVNVAEPSEPNLRNVTFSKEIIVIAYPYDDENEYEDNWNEMNHSVPSSKNICKTVSFSNEVTVIHDRNLRCSDSVESIKESGGRKLETEY